MKNIEKIFESKSYADSYFFISEKYHNLIEDDNDIKFHEILCF